MTTDSIIKRILAAPVYDVAVDVRRNSPHFGRYFALELSAENMLQLFIPKHFAHGFLVMGDSAVFEYKCTAYYAPEHERTVRWDDPDIGIEWPLADGVEPVLSEKDAAAATLREADTYS